MLRDIVLGVAGIAVVGSFVYSYLKYKKTGSERASIDMLSSNIERAYFDELSILDIKEWFEGKLNDNVKGIVFQPTEKKLEEWHLPLEVEENCIMQLLFDDKDQTISTIRKISFSTLDEQMKTFIEDNDGVFVVE